MRAVDLIQKKRDGQTLSDDEIQFLIEGYTKGDIPDYQMSAFTMAVYFRKMNEAETLTLTKAMVQSGDTLDLSAIDGIKVDKHSTGGVGDKTSLSLLPLLASFGLKCAKMSGRGLGHTGGTIDKLESFTGFHTEISNEQFIRQVNNVGMAIVGQTKDLAPADKKLYALRDVTATVENISLIASSIMSKKLAAGADIIILDVKTGKGAFMKTLEDSTALAKEMVAIGNGAGKKTKAVITDMNEPLGNAVGNTLEVIEAIETLKGNGPKDFTELIYALTEQFLFSAGLCETHEEAFRMIDEKIANGEALNKLAQFVEAQGGAQEEVFHPELLPLAKHTTEIPAASDGFIREIECEEIGLCAMLLGGGRAKKEDTIDPGVGFVLHKKIGDPVKCGESLATMYYNSDSVPGNVIDKFTAAYTIGASAPPAKTLIYDVIR
ncbi:MAG: pyrimidine-nucleoside phosphorylase [Lachnospiraceae bacterium]|nr:pyrimidine-nucleoside phosphorylase [Lachnospiraceae bacterium]